jgi:membrane protease YdiL (CAAX protease family)
MSLSPTDNPEPTPDLTPVSEPTTGLETTAVEAPPLPRVRRIPNFGHALIFVAFAGVLLIMFEIILMIRGKAPVAGHTGGITVEHPMLQLAVMAATYLITLLTAWLFFPVLWHRTFLDGIEWHWSTARGQARKLMLLGLALGVTVAVVTSFITSPKSMPIDDFFSSPATAWLITIFGTIAAPVFEEICFRGFLLPAIAIAYDWIALPRTDEARARWQTTTNLSPASLIFAAVLTSIGFAMMHAQQVSHLWAALLILFTVSLVLTFVRVKTRSVAASVLVHATYNGFVFLTTIVATGGYRHLERMTH